MPVLFLKGIRAVKQDGVIVDAEINPDYTRRPESSDTFPVVDAAEAWEGGLITIPLRAGPAGRRRSRKIGNEHNKLVDSAGLLCLAPQASVEPFGLHEAQR